MLGFQPPIANKPGIIARAGFVGQVLVTAFLCSMLPQAAMADSMEDCRRLLIAGKHSECITSAATAIQKRQYGEEWHIFKAQAELALGRYEEASNSISAGIKRYSWSVRLRLLGREAFLHTGDSESAKKMLGEIDNLAGRFPWRYTDADDLVCLGKAALLLGADARDVLDGFYERAKKYHPKHRDSHLAIGQLALDKNDFELAAEIFQAAVKHFENDPDILFGFTQAIAKTDSQQATILLAKTLELNASHVPAILFQVDQLIDSEKYSHATKLIDRVIGLNAKHPKAWAYRSVLAHLQNDPRGADIFRGQALSSWSSNPVVDYLIGKKLSQKYRFSEGVQFQKTALAFDENYLPARIQLAQDLLRLGKEQQGWELADAVHESDGYDVTTFNLLELRDTIDQFRTLEDDDFILRMEAREADIYGQQVLNLLHRAKQTLCAKYGLDLKHKTTIEIFPDQDDFAVRTFGMPAVSGFLGVCFGKVITANSPASQQENPSNWESVLWHEFCHVVTLELTQNRIPRWLSEGISVYEELQENPTWGQRMNPQYREMILDGELTPIDELSSAFLSPKTSMHLQFAYYESALAVEFLIENYGIDSLKLILRDLSAGLPINAALDRNTTDLKKLEKDFDRFVHDKVEGLAPEVDWERHDLAALLNDDSDAFVRWAERHENNFIGQNIYARKLLEEQDWQKAKKPLQRLIKLYPGYTGADNAYEMLARVHRELGETLAERTVLKKYATIDADALNVYLRLLEIQQQAEDWPAVLQTVNRILAVNPLLLQPHRALAEASEKLNRDETAITAYQTLLVMGTGDLVETHYRLAQLLHKKDPSTAKRHLLTALEEAPRYRAAHRLLLEMRRQQE